MGSIPVYIVGKEETNNLGKTYRETSYKDALIETKTDVTETTDAAHTKYYTYSTWSRRWSNSTESKGNYKIENYLKTTITTETIYEIRVREITDVTEVVTTDFVSDDETHVEQSVTKTATTTVLLIDALKRENVTTTYDEYYVYYQKENNTFKKVDQFNYTFTGSYPVSYEMENPPAIEGVDIPLTADEITELKNKEEIKNNYLNGKEEVTTFTREINYTAGVQPITVNSLYTADDSISLAPLNTHITVGGKNIQKYYISTSYSKNYPFFAKIYFEQVAE